MTEDNEHCALHGGDHSPSESFGLSPLQTIGRSRVGRYELIYLIAQGGMAGVYVGRLTGMAGFEKLVAVKVIHPHLTGELPFIHMFLDEARLAACIRHPNVSEIYEVAEDEGLYYMVGELVLGQSLRDFYYRAAEFGLTISQPIAAGVTSAVCQGLHAAHELKGASGELLGLVHRDVSPRNILVSYDGFVKLIDFGVAYAAGRLSNTEAGTIKGKVGFMPPEHLRGRTLDRRSDVFSLGVVLYMLITGVHPFPGGNEAERMQRILKCEPAPPSRINPMIAVELDRIVMKSLATRPADRYETAGQMGFELDRFARTKLEMFSQGELAVLMQSLFPQEIAAHEARLREYRAQHVAKGASGGMEAFVGLPELSILAGRPTVPDRALLKMEPPPAGATSSPKPGLPPFATRHPYVVAVSTLGLGLALGLGGYRLVDRDIEPTAPALMAPLPPRPERVVTQPAPAAPAVPPPSAVSPRHVALTLAFEQSLTAVRILLDKIEAPANTTVLTLPVDGKNHTLEVVAAGYKPFVTVVSPAADRTLRIALEPLVRPRPKSPGKRPHSKPKDGSLKDGSLKPSPYN